MCVCVCCTGSNSVYVAFLTGAWFARLASFFMITFLRKIVLFACCVLVLPDGDGTLNCISFARQRGYTTNLGYTCMYMQFVRLTA